MSEKGGRSPRFANHLTPLIRNAWYVAARSSELNSGLLGRTLLGQRVVLYRTAAGMPVALEDRCPHRSFPLSKSQRIGDQIVCGYHGLTYDESGRCVHIPSVPSATPNLSVRAFPVTQQGPLIWIWLGDPHKADTQLIPELPWLSDPACATVTGGFRIATNYVAMHENLLDQTHFTFLHAGSVGTPEWAAAPLSVSQRESKVCLRRELKRSAPPGIYARPMGVEGRLVDRVSEASFLGPAGHVAFATISNIDPPVERSEYRVNITHLFTPETQDSIHYWWFNSRDFALHDREAGEFLRASSEKAYLEDVSALEWIAEAQNASSNLHEVSFRSDRPGLMMRQELLKMAIADCGS